MKAYTKTIISLGLLTCFSLSIAEPVTDLRNCAKIESDLKRLACFDEAVKGLSGEVTITTTSKVVVKSEDLYSAISELQEPVDNGTVRPKNTFGLQNKLQNEEPEEIHSVIDGEFTGWSGKTVFKLQNGQVWKQVDPTRKVVYKASNPKVTIRKAVFGSYKLKIEGLNSSLTVRRIK